MEGLWLDNDAVILYHGPEAATMLCGADVKLEGKPLLALWESLGTEDDPVVMLLDIDGFAAFNEQHGYACGDAVLGTVGTRLPSLFGTSATVGRSGGDEFMVILPESTPDDALRLAEAALDEIEGLFGATSFRVSASAGIGRARDEEGHVAVSRAVEALYRAQREGGGRARVEDH